MLTDGREGGVAKGWSVRGLALLALFPGAICAQDHVLSRGSAREVGMSDSILNSAVRLYADAVADGRIVGGVLLIARNGRIVVHEPFGFRDLRERSPMQRNTMFRMSANTNAVTAAAVAILADRGRLRFSDPVSKFIPAWDNPRARAITVHQLLTHTSGLELEAFFPPRLFAFPWSGSTLRGETNRIGKSGTIVAPGGYFYSNAGFNALGGLIEAVSGRPLDQFFREEIFEKLGMPDSYSLETESHLGGKLRRMGPTYSPIGGLRWTIRWKPGDPPDVPFATGSQGLISTAHDYAVFMQMLMNGGVYNGVRILETETVRTMLTSHTRRGSLPYGYGWGINAGGVFTHSGSNGTFAWGDPQRGIIVVALAQTTSAVNLRPALMALVNRAVDEGK
jgi:CubicO group peptidase (beta-lactamase class C family)